MITLFEDALKENQHWVFGLKADSLRLKKRLTCTIEAEELNLLLLSKQPC